MFGLTNRPRLYIYKPGFVHLKLTDMHHRLLVCAKAV